MLGSEVPSWPFIIFRLRNLVFVPLQAKLSWGSLVKIVVALPTYDIGSFPVLQDHEGEAQGYLPGYNCLMSGCWEVLVY